MEWDEQSLELIHPNLTLEDGAVTLIQETGCNIRFKSNTIQFIGIKELPNPQKSYLVYFTFDSKGEYGVYAGKTTCHEEYFKGNYYGSCEVIKNMGLKEQRERFITFPVAFTDDEKDLEQKEIDIIQNASHINDALCIPEENRLNKKAEWPERVYVKYKKISKEKYWENNECYNGQQFCKHCGKLMWDESLKPYSKDLQKYYVLHGLCCSKNKNRIEEPEFNKYYEILKTKKKYES